VLLVGSGNRILFQMKRVLDVFRLVLVMFLLILDQVLGLVQIDFDISLFLVQVLMFYQVDQVLGLI